MGTCRWDHGKFDGGRDMLWSKNMMTVRWRGGEFVKCSPGKITMLFVGSPDRSFVDLCNSDLQRNKVEKITDGHLVGTVVGDWWNRSFTMCI